MVLRQRQRFRVTIAKKCKQTDGSGREEEKRQNDEQQDARAEASPEDLRHSAPLSRASSNDDQAPTTMLCNLAAIGNVDPSEPFL
jgi:hypothetical protein